MDKIMSFGEFCKRLMDDGFYVAEDNHVHYPDGKPASRMVRNGYYMVRKMYDAHCYYFMEHRVVWFMHYGDIDDSLVINHKDCDRTNNAIDNLELVTQKRNMEYAKELGRIKPLSESDHPKAYLCKEDVQMIRKLVAAGNSQKSIADFYGFKYANLVSRVVSGARYGEVIDDGELLTLMPQFVMRTARMDLSFEEQFMNAACGICGEAGEAIDLIKKWRYQGHELDLNHLMGELGDILYYLIWMSILLNVDIEDVMFDNVRKLFQRYPDGFKAEQSQNRAEGDV